MEELQNEHKFNETPLLKQCKQNMENMQNENENLKQIIEHNYINGTMEIANLEEEDAEEFKNESDISNLEKIQIMILLQLTPYRNIHEVIDMRDLCERI